MENLRGGMIGCGWVTQMHAQAYARAQGVSIVAASDLDPERMEPVREILGIAATDCYTDYHEMLARDDIDFISVATNNHLHKQMVIDAANAGKHVLCEKALANTLSDCDAMLEATARKGLTLGVYHEGAFYPENVLAKKVLTEEWGSAPRMAWSDAFAISKWHMPPWIYVPAYSGGGIMMTEGIHLAHLNHFYFGEAPVRATAFMDRISAEWHPVEDIAVCTFDFASGIGSTRTSFLPNIGRDQTMCVPGHTIFAEQGSIEFVYRDGAEGPYSPVKTVLIRTPERVREYGMPEFSFPLEKNSHAFTALIENFAQAVADGRAPVVSGVTARAAVEMVLASYESAATGKAIDIPMTPGSPVYDRGVLGLVEIADTVPASSKFRRARLFGLTA